MNEHAVILVDSTSQALRIEKLLISESLTCKLIPVPRHLSSDCGVCLRFMQADLERVQALLEENHFQFRSIERL